MSETQTIALTTALVGVTAPSQPPRLQGNEDTLGRPQSFGGVSDPELGAPDTGNVEAAERTKKVRG